MSEKWGQRGQVQLPHPVRPSGMGTGRSFSLLPSNRHRQQQKCSLQSTQLGVQRKQEDSLSPCKLCHGCQLAGGHRPAAVAQRPWGRMKGLVRSRKPRGSWRCCPSPAVAWERQGVHPLRFRRLARVMQLSPC